MLKGTQTRVSLILRAVNKDDNQAWKEFSHYYQQYLESLLHHLRVPKDEHDEIIQDVLIRLWKSLSSYKSSKAKFRTWLYTIVRNAVGSHMKKINSHREKCASFAEFKEINSGNKFDELADYQWKKYITSQALDRIKKVFSSTAMNVFELSLEGVPTEIIAKRNNISRSSAYKMKNRIKERLVGEINYLRQRLEP